MCSDVSATAEKADERNYNLHTIWAVVTQFSEVALLVFQNGIWFRGLGHNFFLFVKAMV